MKRYSQMKAIDMNGHRYSFINEFGTTRNGFKHHTKLFKDVQYVSEYTAYYINRTWEFYDYQTSMLGACNAHISFLEDRMKSSIKEALGRKKWGPCCEAYKQKMLEDGTDAVAAELNEYNAVMQMLKNELFMKIINF